MEHSIAYKEKEPTLARRDLEGLFPDELDTFISDCYHKKQELDALIALAIDVKENGYGVCDKQTTHNQ
jgi:hypothetical protein